MSNRTPSDLASHGDRPTRPQGASNAREGRKFPTAGSQESANPSTSDVGSAAVELRALRPAEFTAARDEYVAKARKAGDKQLATQLAALRKPTLAAWTAGLLAHRRPKEAHGLVELGAALRAAHQTLDSERLRRLSHDQHVVIGELARTARSGRRGRAGQPPSKRARTRTAYCLGAPGVRPGGRRQEGLHLPELHAPSPAPAPAPALITTVLTAVAR